MIGNEQKRKTGITIFQYMPNNNDRDKIPIPTVKYWKIPNGNTDLKYRHRPSSAYNTVNFNNLTYLLISLRRINISVVVGCFKKVAHLPDRATDSHRQCSRSRRSLDRTDRSARHIRRQTGRHGRCHWRRLLHLHQQQQQQQQHQWHDCIKQIPSLQFCCGYHTSRLGLVFRVTTIALALYTVIIFSWFYRFFHCFVVFMFCTRFIVLHSFLVFL